MFGSNSMKNKINNSKRTKFVKRKRHYRDIKNYNLLKSMDSEYDDKLTVRFNLPDGRFKKMNLNNEFLKTENGKPLSEEKILENLNSIKHDFNADNYVINKL